MRMHLFTNMGCYSSTHLTRISTLRFLGKKEGRGYTSLRWSSQAYNDLLSWRDWSVMSSWIALFSPFENFAQALERKERVTQKWWIYQKIEYQLMKGELRNIFWADNMKHLKVSEGMGKFQICYAIDPWMTRTQKDQSSEEWNCFWYHERAHHRKANCKTLVIKSLGPSCDWRIHTMC
jgi:hypothetical protein